MPHDPVAQRDAARAAANTARLVQSHWRTRIMSGEATIADALTHRDQLPKAITVLKLLGWAAGLRTGTAANRVLRHDTLSIDPMTPVRVLTAPQCARIIAALRRGSPLMARQTLTTPPVSGGDEPGSWERYHAAFTESDA